MGMGGLLWLLVLGGLFFVMMRYGCGAHVSHGGHGGHGSHGGHGPGSGAAELSGGVDPVCGMHVDSGAGYALVHLGRPWRFCSRRCLDAFEREPARFTSATAAPSAHQGGAA